MIQYAKFPVEGKRFMKRLGELFKKVKRWLLALFTVPKCVSCKRQLASRSTFLCRNCYLRFSTERAKACSECGFPHALCACTVQAAGEIYRIVHMVPYDPQNYGVSSRVVFDAKDKFSADTFGFMAEQIGEAMALNNISHENGWIVTWIPRRKSTIRKVGHDQSKTIAKIFAGNYGLKFMRVFVNTGNRPQKMLDFNGRIENAFSSYRVTRHAAKKIKGKTLVIIDDLVTTGATFFVTISLAKTYGADEVIPLTFAKTDRGIKKFKMKRKTHG